MSNAELIERLRDTVLKESKQNYDKCYEAADTLELADKRIAEQAEEITMLRAKHLYTCGTTHPEMYKIELDYAKERIAELEAKIDEAYKKGYATGEEEAERRIAELEAKLNQSVEIIEAFKKLHEPRAHLMLDPRVPELERKLAVAREALRWAYDTATDHDDRLPFDWAIYCEHLYQTLAQIGGEDAGA